MPLLLARCCMPVDEYTLALGVTLEGAIFAVRLLSWYAEAMQHDLFGADVPACRDFPADVDRRSPGWRFFSVSFPRPAPVRGNPAVFRRKSLIFNDSLLRGGYSAACSSKHCSRVQVMYSQCASALGLRRRDPPRRTTPPTTLTNGQRL